MSTFHFKQFSLHDDSTAMKVGTDAVVLGAYADISASPKLVLDIGSGSGVLSLMLAQRVRDAEIHALEIEESAYIESLENYKSSPWLDRISVFNADIINWKSNDKYDLIISNPPFFKEETFSNDLNRAQARSSLKLPFEDLLDAICKLLSETGTCQVIIPYNAQQGFIFEAGKRNLLLHEKLLIRDNEVRDFKRSILKFKFTVPRYVATDTLILRHKDGQYSDSFKSLTKDFYLNF